jgi:hypothetical protein
MNRGPGLVVTTGKHVAVTVHIATRRPIRLMGGSRIRGTIRRRISARSSSVQLSGIAAQTWKSGRQAGSDLRAGLAAVATGETVDTSDLADAAATAETRARAVMITGLGTEGPLNWDT